MYEQPCQAHTRLETSLSNAESALTAATISVSNDVFPMAKQLSTSHEEYRKHRLACAIIICSFLFVVECIGGIFTGSLAILADSFHMLTDVAAYILSFLALYYSSIPKNQVYSYGYKRLEVVGAMFSIGLIWILSFCLLSEAYRRFYNPIIIKPVPMLCMAILGVVSNTTLIFVFGHEEEHSYSEISNEMENKNTSYDASSNFSQKAIILPCEKNFEQSLGDLNIRAAMLHAIGDLVCSVGVLVSASIIYFKPSLQFVDPLCTFMFGIVALSTTFTIIQDIYKVIMQAKPNNVDTQKVESEIKRLSIDICECQCKVWAVSNDYFVADIKLRVHITTSFVHSQKILQKVKNLVEHKFMIAESTVEIYT